MQDRRGIQGRKKVIMTLWGSQAQSQVKEAGMVNQAGTETQAAVLGWISNNKRDQEEPGRARNLILFLKERTRARIKVMRKVKGRITKGERREKGKYEAGVMEENIQELALRVKATLASQEAPANLY